MDEKLQAVLKTVVAGLSKHYTSRSEFVLCESDDTGAQRVICVGNPASGLQLGQRLECLGHCVIPGEENCDGCFNRVIQTPDGRTVRASTLHLRDENQAVVGTLSLRLDVTELRAVRDLIDNEICFGAENRVHVEEWESVDEVLSVMIYDSITHVGVPIARMSREHKIQGIGYLHDRGVFRIKNSSSIVAKFYDISKYTIYNYIKELDRVRAEEKCTQ